MPKAKVNFERVHLEQASKWLALAKKFRREGAPVACILSAMRGYHRNMQAAARVASVARKG